MQIAVSADEESRYTSLIDSILSTSDLTTVSAKKVRKSIQATVAHDISDQKVGRHLVRHYRGYS
jgi:upstream activation factor subunit UAF30